MIDSETEKLSIIEGAYQIEDPLYASDLAGRRAYFYDEFLLNINDLNGAVSDKESTRNHPAYYASDRLQP